MITPRERMRIDDSFSSLKSIGGEGDRFAIRPLMVPSSPMSLPRVLLSRSTLCESRRLIPPSREQEQEGLCVSVLCLKTVSCKGLGDSSSLLKNDSQKLPYWINHVACCNWDEVKPSSPIGINSSHTSAPAWTGL